jgi:hypothetical protein
MATIDELAERGIVGSADVLPVPMGPEPSLFPPAARTYTEKLESERARLQELLAEAVRDARRARIELGAMRERVAEPSGCAYCGAAKRSHGRRYVAEAGVHSWSRPSDEQVKSRMLARRAARLPLPSVPELDALHEELIGANLSLWEEEQETARLRLALRSAQRGRREARARVAELEAERADHFGEAARLLEDTGHDDDAVNFLDLMADGIRTHATPAQPAAGEESVARSADKLTRLLAPTQALREDGVYPRGTAQRVQQRDANCARSDCGHWGGFHTAEDGCQAHVSPPNERVEWCPCPGFVVPAGGAS